jgi:hypothetical protein
MPRQRILRAAKMGALIEITAPIRRQIGFLTDDQLNYFNPLDT